MIENVALRTQITDKTDDDEWWRMNDDSFKKEKERKKERQKTLCSTESRKTNVSTAWHIV